jgi:polyisoprenoid-binding protein YceI
MKKVISLSLVIISLAAFYAFTLPSSPIKKGENGKGSNSKNQAAAKWTLDKAHSTAKFSVTHMVVSETEGSFKMFDGTMENTKADFSDAKISFSVDVNSLSTDNDYRDKHLKSDDFFNAEKFPAMKFESTAFAPQGGNKYKLTGNLTIRDVTKPVTFDVTYGGSIKTQQGTKVGFKATTTINRFDFNLKWDKATETGGLVVSKEVEITVKAELNQAK